MLRKYDLFLNDILSEIKFIKKATKELELKDFKKDEIKIKAITKSLEIIGEAVSKIPEEIKNKYPETEWRKIKGFRDVATHQYWNVDLDYEWFIIKNKLEPLKKQIKKILKEI